MRREICKACAGKRAVSVSCRLLAAVCLPGWLAGWLAGWLVGCNISEMCLGVRPCAAPILNSSRHCPPVTRLLHARFQFPSEISLVLRFRWFPRFLLEFFFLLVSISFFSDFLRIFLMRHLCHCNSSNILLKAQNYRIFHNIKI